MFLLKLLCILLAIKLALHWINYCDPDWRFSDTLPFIGGIDHTVEYNIIASLILVVGFLLIVRILNSGDTNGE
jgi:hypothetical protein